ncbi:MAG TPA: hypothetical protein GX693_05555 [Firmicutes bacterium]|nr:hypothetical protein [Bacillota bacterium]
MTAEIAIMNKEAVALAADSAVTLTGTQEGLEGSKIFITANKIFSLSKYQPVGVMVYGNAQFMGIPWETIIKIYRDQLGDKSFDTLKEYALDFISFITEENNHLFNQEDQDHNFLLNIKILYNSIRNNILADAKDVIRKNNNITDEQRDFIVSMNINKYYKMILKSKKLGIYTPELYNKINESYGGEIKKLKKQAFEKLPLSSSMSRKLTKIAIELFLRDIFFVDLSGVVFAGFGNKECFPSVVSYIFDCLVLNNLKHREDLRCDNDSAGIIPFAQQEMVFSFMEGVDPDYQIELDNAFGKTLNQYSRAIVDKLKINKRNKDSLQKELNDCNAIILQEFKKDLAEHRRKRYVDPIMKVVRLAPKNELADMAEALVSLTSFKRRVSWTEETVAGPIDVAVISKGDGFVWIKRKHYFKADLNPQFFANYNKKKREDCFNENEQKGGSDDSR